MKYSIVSPDLDLDLDLFMDLWDLSGFIDLPPDLPGFGLFPRTGEFSDRGIERDARYPFALRKTVSWAVFVKNHRRPSPRRGCHPMPFPDHSLSML